MDTIGKSLVLMMLICIVFLSGNSAMAVVNSSEPDALHSWRDLRADTDNIYTSRVVKAIRDEYMPDYLKYSTKAMQQKDWNLRKMFRGAAAMKLKKA